MIDINAYVGKKFGNVVVIGEGERSKEARQSRRKILLECQCERNGKKCGNRYTFNLDRFIHNIKTPGHPKGCKECRQKQREMPGRIFRCEPDRFAMGIRTDRFISPRLWQALLLSRWDYSEQRKLALSLPNQDYSHLSWKG